LRLKPEPYSKSALKTYEDERARNGPQRFKTSAEMKEEEYCWVPLLYLNIAASGDYVVLVK
jgi:hypothetical protein